MTFVRNLHQLVKQRWRHSPTQAESSPHAIHLRGAKVSRQGHVSPRRDSNPWPPYFPSHKPGRPGIDTDDGMDGSRRMPPTAFHKKGQRRCKSRTCRDRSRKHVQSHPRLVCGTVRNRRTAEPQYRHQAGRTLHAASSAGARRQFGNNKRVSSRESIWGT
jgi:hypothetical protein